MSIPHLYNITVDVQRPTITQGAMGEQIETWAVVFNDIKGRLQQRNPTPAEVEDLGRRAVYSFYNFYCDTTHNILATDRIIHGSRTFEVLSFPDDSNQMGVFQKVQLMEIK